MKKKNTAMYELLENTGKEIAGIRRSIENLEQMLIAIGMGTCSEQEEDSPEIPDSFCGEDEMDFVNAEDQEDGILLVNPGMPYVLISCDKAMQFMDNLREPCQIILEKGGQWTGQIVIWHRYLCTLKSQLLLHPLHIILRVAEEIQPLAAVLGNEIVILSHIVMLDAVCFSR